MEEEPLKKTWTRKLRMGLLGLINGAVYSVIMLLLIWWWRAAADSRHAIESTISGDYVLLVSNERWIPIVLIWLFAFTSATVLVDYFWKNWNGQVLFWLAVGLIAVASWNAFGLVGTWLDKQAGDTISYSRVTSAHNPLFGPISLAVVVVVNVIYGYLVRAFAKS